jgi:hypothetical protein
MIKINYDEAYKNNFRNNVEGAVNSFLNSNKQFVLYPKALNPFLKILETLKLTRNLIILPAFDNDTYDEFNRPAYLIIKFNGNYNAIDQISTN